MAWMALAALCFAATFGFVRGLSGTFHTFEIVLLRSLIGIIVLLPWLWRSGVRTLYTRRWRVYLTRASVGYGAMVLWFYALITIPLADAAALQFTMPLWTIVFAVLALGERAGSHRWIATLAGFAGALVIIRPGFIETSWAALAVLVSAACYAGTNIMTKSLARTDDRTAVVFHSFLLGLALAVGPALWVWTTPTLADLPMIAGFGLATAGAHLALTRALAVADASAVGPVDYLRLPAVALIGFVFYGETTGPWTWAGAMVIVASTWHLSVRERAAMRG